MALVSRVRGPGLVLPLERADELWLARMVLGEEGAGREGAWVVSSVMLRRWWMLVRRYERRGGPVPYSRLRAMVRAYSTPLQRGHHVEKPWSAIPPSIRAGVRDATRGRRRLAAPGAVHFARHDVVEANMELDWQIVETGAANVVVSNAEGRALPPLHVEPAFAGGPLWAAVGAAAGVGGVWAWQRYGGRI